MKKLIVANWKMNPSSLKEAKRIFNETKKAAGGMSRVETVICPPSVFLSSFRLHPSAVGSSFKLGAQDVFWQEKGTHTGEISATMLKNLGVKYVIIGHSERRELGETNEIINKKIKTALRAGLKVIFCVGEKERDNDGNYFHFIKEEISEGLKNIPKKFFNPLNGGLIIAYEPIWAIGKSGSEADSPEKVFQMSIYIRRALLPIVGGKISRIIPILYGGSVDSKNCERFLKEGGVQGLLVGHESLIPKDFNAILQTANRKQH